ncbi:MAG TPA: hypothetical protein VGY77_06615 [Gemmataceae bacterium]|nr:hypothetical protein [Gemmataceae bacterium]
MAGFFALHFLSETMKRWLVIVITAAMLTGFGLGCGGDTGKGINSGLDKPLPKEEKPK